MFDPNGFPVSFATKFSAYPHISAVLGWRGVVALHRKVDGYLNGMYFWPRGIESAVERLPGYLRRAATDYGSEHPRQDPLKVAQCWLLGWCTDRNRFGGWVISSREDFEPRELECPSTHLNPGNDYAPPPPELRDPSILIRIVAAQQEMDAMQPPRTIGGDLLLAKLDKTGLQVSKAARLDGYNELVERMCGLPAPRPRQSAAA